MSDILGPMSPLGIQRLIALILFLSPWIFIPGAFKNVIFIIAGILLFISTLDLRKRSRPHDTHEERSVEASTSA